MSIIKTLEHPHSLKNYPNLNALVGTLRQALGIEPLTSAQRRQHGGRWFQNASDFAGRAARAREVHEDLMRDFPYRGPDIEARRQRIALLEKAHVLFTSLTKSIADTLLKERAELMTMSTLVLRTLENAHDHPFQALDQKDALAATIKLMRKELDRRNHKISVTKRAQAAAERAQEAGADDLGQNPKRPE